MNLFNAHLVIIDGIIDIVTKNDEEEAIRITDLFLKWTEQKQLHIITNIHENKEGNNSRGVVGAKLDAKAETVFRMQRDGKQFDFIAFHTRDEEPPKITFVIEEELPRITESTITSGRPQKRDITQLSDSEKIILLFKAYKETHIEMSYQNLMFTLQKIFLEVYTQKLGDNNAKKLISNLVGLKLIIQNGTKQPYYLSEEIKKSFEKQLITNQKEMKPIIELKNLVK